MNFKSFTLIKAALGFLFIICLTEASVIFPLTKGDKRAYSISSYASRDTTVIEQVSGDTLLGNGKRYAAIQRTYPSRPDYRLFEFYRVSHDSVFRFVESTEEVLFYSLQSRAGDTFSIPILYGDELDSTSIITTWTGTREIFGQQRRAWEFTVDFSKQMADDEVTYTLVEGIGIYRVSGLSFSFSLSSAEINGMTYSAGQASTAATQPLPPVSSLRANVSNAGIEIQYEIRSAGPVTVDLFNPLGEKLKSVSMDHSSPGRYSVFWDTAEFNSGVYLLKYNVVGKTSAQKVILHR